MSRREPNEGLPPFAVEYLTIHCTKAVPSSRRVIRWFHIWLKRTGQSIRQLDPPEISEFLEPILAAQKLATRAGHRRKLFRYFDWLYVRNLLSFDPTYAWPRDDVGLPSRAELFIRTREPTHKPSTINSYRSGLRHFNVWLVSQRLTPDALERVHISSWFQSLHERKFSAGHRVNLILAVRAYFEWLEEQPDYTGKSSVHLFRRGDLPKLPQYLPRPISAELDRVLQRRLGKSRSLPALGLLLMRRTGLRIGELRALPFHCVQSDHLNNNFLKVPLGKLNNERLVPLDRRTMRLVQKLRIEGTTGKRGKRRTLLLESPSGKPISFAHYRLALKRACRGLVFAEPMTSHRLRHTYATSMLVAGVSLPVLMKLLGHRDYKMTLRYAAITIDTVATEYADAVQVVEQRYQLRKTTLDNTPSSPNVLTDLARHIIKHVDDAGLDKSQARSLVRRLNRLDTAIQRLLRECRQATQSE